MGKSTLVGIGVGAGVGALSTSFVTGKGRSAMVVRGAKVGGLLGGVGAYALHRVVTQREERVRRETLFNLESHGISTGFDGVDLEKFNMFMTSPEVREDYVETHTTEDGRKLIQGHKTWTIIGYPQFNLLPPKVPRKIRKDKKSKKRRRPYE